MQLLFFGRQGRSTKGCLLQGGLVHSGPRTIRQFQSPVNKPTRSTTLLLAPLMRTLMLRNSSGISAVVILRYDSQAI